MAQRNVSELAKDQRFEGFLLVRSSEQRTGGNGAKYLDLNLADKTGEVNAKVWDGNVPPPAVGTVVKVRGGTLEYNGRLQLRVERIRPAQPGDEVNVSALNVHATADGFAIFSLTISVSDSEQLDQVMRKIHNISSVMKVNRPAG